MKFTYRPYRSLLIVCLAMLGGSTDANAQNLTEQKSVVAFIFGNVHPVDADKKPVKDASGKPMEVEMALGTGFFVGVPEPRGGPTYGFTYLVTAKHVLKDFDGTYLQKVKLRLNLLSPSTDKGFDLDTEVPVSDGKGTLLWYCTNDEADDLVVFPLLPDVKKYAFKNIPVTMFVSQSNLKSDAVEEGDRLYFIGLMEQYYGAKKNYPVVRSGTLALMTDEKIGTPTGMQNVFIAQLESWPGNSGSPVFLNLGGLRGNTLYAGQRISFLGILVGGFLNRMSGSVVGQPLTMTMGNDYNTGVSFIVPAPRIREILDSPDVQQSRERQVQEFLKSNPH